MFKKLWKKKLDYNRIQGVTLERTDTIVPATKNEGIEELKKENNLLLEQVKSLSKTRILTVDVKAIDIEDVNELIKALHFYATTPRSGLHEDGGNLARKALDKFSKIEDNPEFHNLVLDSIIDILGEDEL